MERRPAAYAASFFRLLFPALCAGCSRDLTGGETFLCLHCRRDMADTGFAAWPDNPVYGLFRPILPVERAAAAYFYTRGSVIQRLLMEVKYRGNRKLAVHLGELLGTFLLDSSCWTDVDCLLPVPLHPARQARRGFNQSAMICRGMSEILQVPALENVLIRKKRTSTQTRKVRVERWDAMEGVFGLSSPETLAGRCVLLVDDVITTGATLAACASVLANVDDVRISIASVAYAERM